MNQRRPRLSKHLPILIVKRFSIQAHSYEHLHSSINEKFLILSNLRLHFKLFISLNEIFRLSEHLQPVNGQFKRPMITFLKELWGFGLKAYVRSKFCWIWSRTNSICHFQRRNLDCFEIHEMMYFLWFTTWMLTRIVIINIYRKNCSIKYFYDLVTSFMKVSLQILAEKKFNSVLITDWKWLL